MHILSFVCLTILIIAPYAFLLYKEVNVRIRLFLASIAELVLFLLSYTILASINQDYLMGYFYSPMVFTQILINIIVIVLLWIVKP
jgi:hypothetical protein